MYDNYVKQTDLGFSIYELSNLIRNKKINISDLLRYFFTLVERYNPIINSFITILKDQAFKDAEIIENELEHGK